MMVRFAQRKAVTEHFDKRATEYFPWYSDKSWMGYAFRARRQRVIELFDQPGRKVLDVAADHDGKSRQGRIARLSGRDAVVSHPR